MILAIDLGKKTSGLAISESSLASPYKTLTHNSDKEALAKINAEIAALGAKIIVLGFVEGKIKPFFENFARQLEISNPSTKVVLIDETLTSRQATEQMVKLHVARHKRQEKEHEVAAALILQSYLDEQGL